MRAHSQAAAMRAARAEAATFDELGGRRALERVNRVFYDKVYAHPWLSRFFEDIPQHHIEEQQTDFMQGVLGGPDVFRGHTPMSAHRHIMVTQELFDLRHALLAEALDEARAHPELAERWLKVDRSFRFAIVKRSRADCSPRNPAEGVLDPPRPRGC